MANAAEQKPHADDEKTLSQLTELAAYTSVRDAMEDAYYLGRIRGRIDATASALDSLKAPVAV